MLCPSLGQWEDILEKMKVPSSMNFHWKGAGEQERRGRHMATRLPEEGGPLRGKMPFKRPTAKALEAVWMVASQLWKGKLHGLNPHAPGHLLHSNSQPLPQITNSPIKTGPSCLSNQDSSSISSQPFPKERRTPQCAS